MSRVPPRAHVSLQFGSVIDADRMPLLHMFFTRVIASNHSRSSDVATIAQRCTRRRVFRESTARLYNLPMSNVQGFARGDFLIFQIESGFGLMRVLAIDETEGDTVWHVRVYRDLFPEIDYAELAIASPDSLTPEIDHIALTERAFESTQVSRLGNSPVGEHAIKDWDGEVSDRSIRLLLGLR